MLDYLIEVHLIPWEYVGGINNVFLFDCIYRLRNVETDEIKLSRYFLARTKNIDDLLPNSELIESSVWDLNRYCWGCVNRSEPIYTNDLMSYVRKIPVNGSMFRIIGVTRGWTPNHISIGCFLDNVNVLDRTIMQWDSYDILFQLEFPIDYVNIDHGMTYAIKASHLPEDLDGTYDCVSDMYQGCSLSIDVNGEYTHNDFDLRQIFDRKTQFYESHIDIIPDSLSVPGDRD